MSSYVYHYLIANELPCLLIVLTMSAMQSTIAAVLLVCLVWPVASEAARRAEPMLQYRVDLQQPPETRWREILSHYNDSVPLILDYFYSLVSLVLVASQHHDTAAGTQGAHYNH